MRLKNGGNKKVSRKSTNTPRKRQKYLARVRKMGKTERTGQGADIKMCPVAKSASETEVCTCERRNSGEAKERQEESGGADRGVVQGLKM